MTTLALAPIGAQTQRMDMNSRLRDSTAEEYSIQMRHACIQMAVLKDSLGEMLAHDPEALDTFLTSRKVAAPVKLLIKSAVAAMDTTSGLAPSVPMLAAFLGAVDRRHVLGSLGAVRVPSRKIVGAAQTATATGYWLGEAIAKPLSALAFAATALTPLKCVAQIAVSEELLLLSDALSLCERATVSATASAIDAALLDPTNAGIADVKPASLTNGLVAITPAGDLANNVGQALAAISGGAPKKPVLVVSLQPALRLTGLRDLEAAGVRVVVTPAAADNLIAIDADGIAFSDDGGALRIGAPLLEMADDPATPSVAGTVLLATWQRNLKVIRGERWVNWAKRADAVAFLTLAA